MQSIFQAGEQFLQNQNGGGNNGGGGGGGGGLNLQSLGGIVQHASNNDQGGSGNQELFSRVAGMLQTKAPGMDGDISDDELKRAHDKVNNSGGSVGSNDIGNAAALGAIKNVLSGSGDSTNGGSSGFQEKLVGAAMAHAGTLFDQRSNAGQAEGTKEDAMHKAGEAVMKLLIKNQMTGMIGGGSSGGLGQLAKLVM